MKTRFLFQQMTVGMMAGLLIFGGASNFAGAKEEGQAVASPTATAGGPVITCLLGSDLRLEQKKMSDELLRERIVELKGRGFSISWEVSFPTWYQNVLENQPQIDFHRKKAAWLREQGIASSFGFHWESILPKENEADFREALLGVKLNPKNGHFRQPKGWDFGSEEALKVFAQRSRKLFERMGPVEMFYVDEVLMAMPNKLYPSRISTYWTSPTYSEESLRSFRRYLRQKGDPQADQAKFPVTTRFVAADADHDGGSGADMNQAIAEAGQGKGGGGMGLPAIVINDSNGDRLVEDNDWPNSVLWKNWYDWRETLFAQWVHAVTSAAYDVWGKLPQWQGCMISYPDHWYVPALGPNLDKLAALPHVDYLVAGYCSGMRYAKIKDAALRHGKKWGGMVELWRYGSKEGMNPDQMVDSFQQQVNAGASLILVYPGASFRQDRNPKKADATAGPPSYPACLGYGEDQVKAWGKCIEWLEQGRGYQRIIPVPERK